MTAHFTASTGPAGSLLRDHVISNYQHAQRIIEAMSTAPPARVHSAMAAYGKTCDQIRSDISQASKLFPETESLIAWLLDELAEEVMPKQDRINLALVVRTIIERPAAI